MKKRIIVILSAITLCFGLIGCYGSSGFSSMHNLQSVSIWTDKETGVQYVIYEGYKQGGIVPRLNADGSLHVGNKESEE